MSARPIARLRGLALAALLACALPGHARAALDVVARLSEDRIEPGGVVSLVVTVTDPGGAVADPASTDPSAQGIRRFHDLLAAEQRVSATAIQTAGAKGDDGFPLALGVPD